jgi:hypothetical protein
MNAQKTRREIVQKRQTRRERIYNIKKKLKAWFTIMVYIIQLPKAGGAEKNKE